MDQRDDPHFDRYAGRYDALHRNSIRASGEEPDYFAAYKAEYVRRMVPAESRPRILDFGCGIGNSIPHLAERFPGAELTGVDVSGDSLELARGLHPRVRFERIEGESLPLPDACVDIAIAACVFHHIPPPQRAHWVAELRRVLVPGGRLVVFEHNPLNPVTQRVVAACEFDDDAILLPKGETLGLLRTAGFEAVGADYIVFFPRALAALRPVERHLAWLPAGAQYAAHGQVGSR
jgi:ubiquinone/menaquinone biosynthesis C-methylase UbiE